MCLLDSTPMIAMSDTINLSTFNGKSILVTGRLFFSHQCSSDPYLPEYYTSRPSPPLSSFIRIILTYASLGGASGIGLAIVTRFARVGARVTIADLYSSAGKSIAADLTSQGYSVTFASCDVTEYSSCVAAFKHAMDFSPTKSLNAVALMAGVVGEPSSLVEQVLDARNNSAGSQRGERELEPPRPCHRALDVNLLGVYDCAYLALWYMSLDEKKEAKKDGEGPGVCKEKGGTKSLILISSTVAYTDVPQFADYHTSKCKCFPFPV